MSRPTPLSLALGALAVALMGSASCGFEGGDGAGGDADTGAGGGDRGPEGGAGGSGGGIRGGAPVELAPDSDAPMTGAGTDASSTPSSSGAGSTELACEGIASDYDRRAVATVDDSNSYATPMLVRELTGDSAWSVGDPLPVRAHEFLNAYGRKIDDGLVSAILDETLHVGVDARVDEAVDHRGRRLVRLAVSLSAHGADDVSVPDVTFLMDASPSMGGEAVERLQGVLRGAGRTISETRSVAALTTRGGGTVVRAMGPWNGPTDVDALAEEAAELDPDAAFEPTLFKALDVAREQANESALPGVVFVVTDGASALSRDATERVARERDTWPPVRVVGVGVGPARSYVDEVLETLTDQSGGAYFYAPSTEAAESELEARYTSLTQIAARGVELELQIPPTMTLVGATAGDEASTSDAQNLGVDSSMIFYVYLLAEAETTCQTVGMSLRWADANDERAPLRTFPDAGHLDVELWRRFGADEATPGASFRRIEAIVAAADALRGPTDARLQSAIDQVDAVLAAGASDEPIASLCGPLARFCSARDVDCRACADR